MRKYLTEHVSITADPWIDVLSRQRFEADAMYEMLRNQTAAAVADGYESLRLVADMDWLLPAELPSRR